MDTASGVNSTTEELVVGILIENREPGINLGLPQHPIAQLERWDHSEHLCGVVGNKPVQLIGAVVILVEFLEVGKTADRRG